MAWMVLSFISSNCIERWTGQCSSWVTSDGLVLFFLTHTQEAKMGPLAKYNRMFCESSSSRSVPEGRMMR